MNAYGRWQRLFLVCFGLFAGTTFCMKWVEGSFVVNGSPFSIMGLELTYPQAKIGTLFSALTDPVKKLLRFNLYTDFLFMAAVYPGIAALCMMAREKMRTLIWRRILLTFAVLQVVAWGCDITENNSLLEWLKSGRQIIHFSFYHFIVALKWTIALTAVLLAIPLIFRKRKHFT